MAQTATNTRAKGTYGIKAWDEKTWDGKDHKEQPGAKLTHAKITFTFEGDMKGEAQIHLLMDYRDDTYATIVGLQRFTGKLGDRTGSFDMTVNGVFENAAAKSTWSIILGSGTGDLRGIKGEGSTVARHGDTQPFTLDYSFE